MQNWNRKFQKPGGIFDPEGMEREIKKLEEASADPNLWNDREQAEKTLTKLKNLKRRYHPWVELKQQFKDLKELVHIAIEEDAEGMEKEIEATYYALEARFKELKVYELLNGELDGNDAFLTIHAGAGGTEACDWVAMLLRMYLRWAERRGFKTETIDLLEAEGGIKSVTVQVKGEFAFGYLKCENGIHRLVRISPFDSSSRRHTSFASVYISAVIEDDIDVEIKPDELRIDTYRAQGAGGQHVNKTDSAVRMTHEPTGIVVQCQNERSQHKNKEMAMKVLKSKLYSHYKAEQEQEMKKHAQEKRDISWGNQIRSYVYHPYTMVKDHRTKLEKGNIQAVMDGEIDEFIEEYLRYSWTAKD